MTHAERRDRARGHRRRSQGLYPLPPPRDPHPGGPRGGEPRYRGRVRRGGSRLQRGSSGAAVRRPRWRPPDEIPRDAPLAARRRVHHEHREVPAARQPRPGTRRDRRLRAVPDPPARGPRSRARRDARPPLPRPVHAGRADLAGAWHGPARRSGNRRPECDGVRPLPPGRRPPDARHRADELRRRRAHPGRPARVAPPARRGGGHRPPPSGSRWGRPRHARRRGERTRRSEQRERRGRCDRRCRGARPGRPRPAEQDFTLF